MNKQAQALLSVGTLVAIALVVAVPILIVSGGQTDTLQTRVAFWALGVSVVTLIAIAIQIKLASDEVGFVKQDLENNKLQLAEAMKRPTLSCRLRHAHGHLAGPEQKYTDTALYCSIVNTGSRLSNAYLLELFIRRASLDHENLTEDQARTVDGESYRVYASKSGFMPIYPNSVPQSPTPSQVGIVLQAGRSHEAVLWRIYDHYGRYEITPDNSL